jgi:hypothetical protein
VGTDDHLTPVTLRQVRIATICGSLQTASANDAVLSVVERMLV